MDDKIYIKRKRRKNISRHQNFLEKAEIWGAYWRANPHRFVTEWLGLILYDFQKIIIYLMFKFPKFIFVASRGLAKSTLSLIFSIAYCILYPGTTVVIVAPTQRQSKRFVEKIYDLKRGRPNLESAIVKDGIHIGANESSIEFANGSKIFTLPYSENALGVRCNILIVDEFVRTEKEIITRVFVPMLTSPRTPAYISLSKEEKDKLPIEPNRQYYLSSIRRADEWSYKYFLTYVDEMLKGNNSYMAVALPYNFGVKSKYILRDTIEQSFRENADSIEILLAEYLCIPEKGAGNAFYKYSTLLKRRDNAKAMICMSDEEYIEYKDNKSRYPFYVEKMPNEIRLLCMDVALVESSNNDNTAFWIIRLLPNAGKYLRIFSYAESMHGINSLLQVKRAKQLFYEFDCDYFVLDANGVGVGIFDIATSETYDENRDVTYPAWTVINPEDVKMSNRTISSNAVPVVYSVKTGIRDKSQMLIHSRDILATDNVSLLVDSQEAIDYLNKNYKYYKIEDTELRARMLNPYVQTSSFINEAINLESVIVQGYFSAKEKSGRRKDRVMSLVYGLNYAAILEDNLLNNSSYGVLDYVFSL